MGFTPAQTKAMSLWEFNAAVEGYNLSQGGKPKTTYPTIAEHKRRIAESKARELKANK